jgi:2-keto-3-deoxy-galactonokinase
MQIFEQAVECSRALPDAALTHLLFQCRSRQLAGELSRSAAPHFLSGLLIGQDAQRAHRLFADVLQSDAPVIIIGTEQLIDLHTRAFASVQQPTRSVDGGSASLAGLTALHARSNRKERFDAV